MTWPWDWRRKYKAARRALQNEREESLAEMQNFAALSSRELAERREYYEYQMGLTRGFLADLRERYDYVRDQFEAEESHTLAHIRSVNRDLGAMLKEQIAISEGYRCRMIEAERALGGNDSE